VDLLPSVACATGPDDRGVWFASFSVMSAIITALLAPSRGRSAFWWFLIGGFLPWVSILLLYLFQDLNYGAPPGAEPRPTAPKSGPLAWPSVSEPAIALPQDGWFYANRRQALGPVSLQYLRGAIQTGALGKNSPVWCSAFRDWVTPNRVPGFFG
jgi:hypothetical protein